MDTRRPVKMQVGLPKGVSLWVWHQTCAGCAPRCASQSAIWGGGAPISLSGRGRLEEPTVLPGSTAHPSPFQPSSASAQSDQMARVHTEHSPKLFGAQEAWRILKRCACGWGQNCNCQWRYGQEIIKRNDRVNVWNVSPWVLGKYHGTVKKDLRS